VNIKEQKNCDLCGQVVELEGFTVNTREGLKKFCCAGCQSIFQLLNEEILTTQQPTNNK